MSLVERVTALLAQYGINDQRTDAWHAKRGEMLTASEIYKAVKDATPAARRELTMSKLVPKDYSASAGVRALVWGTQFEPIAKKIYEDLHSIRIVDTSCVQHPTHAFLGASPDGIIVSDGPLYGHLVEFKCPISRDFDDTTGVPPQYMHQMQLQMECTGLDVCHYAEFKFRATNYSEWMDTAAEYKSAYIVLDDGTVLYKGYNESRGFADWKADVLKERDVDAFGLQTVYWTLTKYKFQTVHKDPAWLESNLPSFQEVWAEIQAHRQAGTLPEHPREKQTLSL